MTVRLHQMLPGAGRGAPREQKLAGVIIMLLNVIEDAMETPQEAASWAKTGDMQGYIDDAVKILEDFGYLPKS